MNGWGGGYGVRGRGIGGFFDSLPPVTAWMLKANVLAFLVTLVGDALQSPLLQWLYSNRNPMAPSVLALHPQALLSGCVWQAVTYMFLHRNWLHLLFNMLALWFMGPETERRMGTWHFLAMYLLSGVLGGRGWAWLTGWNSRATCVGASGAVYGVLAAFATLYPNRRLTVFLLIFPITAEAWKIVLGLALVQYLLVTGGSNSNIAYTAHLAGAFAGFLYVDQLFENRTLRGWLGRLTGMKGWSWPRRRSRKEEEAPDPAEVERILEKISREGIGSLTRSERETLQRASRSGQ